MSPKSSIDVSANSILPNGNIRIHGVSVDEQITFEPPPQFYFIRLMRRNRNIKRSPRDHDVASARQPGRPAC
jgi:hypothetical protein